MFGEPENFFALGKRITFKNFDDGESDNCKDDNNAQITKPDYLDKDLVRR
jgi:hypothetical protein